MFVSLSIVSRFRSVSFILANAAMAFILLAFCYFTIDDKNWWNGAPFIFPGGYFWPAMSYAYSSQVANKFVTACNKVNFTGTSDLLQACHNNCDINLLQQDCHEVDNHRR